MVRLVLFSVFIQFTQFKKKSVFPDRLATSVEVINWELPITMIFVLFAASLGSFFSTETATTKGPVKSPDSLSVTWESRLTLPQALSDVFKRGVIVIAGLTGFGSTILC